MTNWKTTVLGIAIAVLNVLAQSQKGNLSKTDVATSVGIAALGAMTKDHDK